MVVSEQIVTSLEYKIQIRQKKYWLLAELKLKVKQVKYIKYFSNVKEEKKGKKVSYTRSRKGKLSPAATAAIALLSNVINDNRCWT